MSPKEQRIAIAEFMGFQDIHRGSRRWIRTALGNTLWGTKDAPSINYSREYSIIPSYGTDLNACREFEIQLEAEDNHAYGCYCSELHEKYGNTISLTAVQRCETFLKTIDRWKE